MVPKCFQQTNERHHSPTAFEHGKRQRGNEHTAPTGQAATDKVEQKIAPRIGCDDVHRTQEKSSEYKRHAGGRNDVGGAHGLKCKGAKVSKRGLNYLRLLYKFRGELCFSRAGRLGQQKVVVSQFLGGGWCFGAQVEGVTSRDGSRKPGAKTGFNSRIVKRCIYSMLC